MGRVFKVPVEVPALKLTGGSPGSNKVAESDASGNVSWTSTLDGIRVNERVHTQTTTNSLGPDISLYDVECITALAEDMTISAVAGTPVDGNKLLFRIKDDGTPRNLTWDAIFNEAMASLPTVTVPGEELYIGTIYNDATDLWDVVAGLSGGAGNGYNISRTITQTAHGFAHGDFVRLSGTAYVLAQADASDKAEVVGMVTDPATDTFTLVMQGYVDGLSGLTADEVYFLSPSSGGAMTTTEPTTGGHISKPVLLADTTTSGYVLSHRGMVIPDGPTSIAAQVADLLFPVGSIYSNATNNTNPATLLGFGTWSAFGQSRVMVGAGQDSQVYTFATSALNATNDTFDVSSTDKILYTGQSVTFTTSGSAPSGLTNATTYYVIRFSSTTIKLATTVQNAVAGTAINFTTVGSGTHTLTYTLSSRAGGEVGGEEAHSQVSDELVSHLHGTGTYNVRANVGDLQNGAGNLDDFPGSGGPISATNQQVGTGVTGSSGSTGGSNPMNNMQPYIVVYMWRRTA